MDVYFHLSMCFYVEYFNKNKSTDNTDEASQKKFHGNKKAPVLPEANRII